MSPATIKNALLFILGIEIFSFCVFYLPDAGNFTFLVLCGLFIILAVFKLRLALLIAIGEVFIGGFGYLFFYDLDGTKISIRMALFIILLAVWLVHLIKERGKAEFIHSKFRIPYLIFLGFLIIGLVNAVIRGNEFSNIFFDFNAWLFFAYLFILYDYLQKDDLWRDIWNAGIACFIWIGLKTMFVLYIFSHGIESLLWPMYFWIRDTRVGEITLMTSNIYRIFFQSQIYNLIGLAILATFLFLAYAQLKRLERRGLLLMLILGSATVLISLSRSFWAGAIAVLPFIIFFAIYDHIKFRKFAYRAFLGFLSIVFALGFLFIIVNFPIPEPAGGSFGSLIAERSNISDEAAASSRWNLLPALWEGIKKEPILGQGFGATVTYQSLDPRILEENPSGMHTTYAFEWGLLDIWYKIGILGMLAYFAVLVSLAYAGIKEHIKNKKLIMPLALIAGLIVLFTTNFFTPYLNHPLGIMYIILISVYLDKK